MDQTEQDWTQAGHQLARVMDAVIKDGHFKLAFSCDLASPAWKGDVSAVVSREPLRGGDFIDTLHLARSQPGSSPAPVVSLSRLGYSKDNGHLHWATHSEPELAAGADPVFATALCKAAADALAPKPPSFLDRLLGRRPSQAAPARQAPGKTP